MQSVALLILQVYEQIYVCLVQLHIANEKTNKQNNIKNQYKLKENIHKI